MLSINVFHSELAWRVEAERRGFRITECCCLPDDKHYCYDVSRECSHLLCFDGSGEKQGIFRTFLGYGFMGVEVG